MCKKRKKKWSYACQLSTFATWNKKQNKENKKRWSLKVTFWYFMQPLCCLLENFIHGVETEMWSAVCHLQRGPGVPVGLERNSTLQADGHLGPGPRSGSGNGGRRLVWGMRFLLQRWQRERELEKGACLFGYVAGRLWMNWGLLSSLSPGKSLSVLAVTKATERKTEMRDTLGDRPEASTSLGLANVMSQYITSFA